MLPLPIHSDLTDRASVSASQHSFAVKGEPIASLHRTSGGILKNPQDCLSSVLCSVRRSEAIFICPSFIPLSVRSYVEELWEFSVECPADYSLRHCVFISVWSVKKRITAISECQGYDFINSKDPFIKFKWFFYKLLMLITQFCHIFCLNYNHTKQKCFFR